MTNEQFRLRVLSYLKRKKIAPSTFSRNVMGDPSWVANLMGGSEAKEATRKKVLEAMK